MPTTTTDQPVSSARTRGQRTLDIASVFLKIGFTAFGGPAALIGMTQDEVVKRRKWLTREHFIDIVAITNLIPGPNATEIAIMVGYLYAGWLGVITAGLCIIVPAAAISALLGWIYVTWGALPIIAPFFLGIKPVVVTIVAAAVWNLAGSITRDWRLIVISVATGMAALLSGNEIAALLVGGVVGALWLRVSRTWPGVKGRAAAILLGLAASGWLSTKTAMAAAASLAEQVRQVSLWDIALYFLKIGSVLYGSGYVLIAFLEGGLVRDLGWLTPQQLLDAIAVGQFTPGPLLSTASFIGYLLGGVPGAAVATLGVFAPSFLFVALLAPWLPRLRRSPWAALFLDAVGAASVGLMAVVALQLGRETLTSLPAWLIALGAAWAGIRMKVNFVWLVLGGAAVGWGLWALGIAL